MGVTDGGGGQDVDNILTRGSGRGEYLTARIARDRPDILERMKAGAFSSVRKIKKLLI
jgi:hypothetical protein